MTESQLLIDRARGALLGAACGDALGAPFEGSRDVRPDELAEWVGSDRLLRYTDDTAMLLALGEYLVALPPGRPVDEQQLVEVFARAWQREPWRGYGAGPPRIFTLVLDGMSWSEAAGASFSGRGSFGNGGAMRVAPVAVAESDLGQVAAQARASARTTHGHLLGQEGAVLQAGAVALALASPPGEPLAVHGVLDRLGELVAAAEYQDKLEIVRRLVDHGTPEEAADELGNDVTAVASVPTALLAFLRHPDSCVDAIGFAIRAGGDTDTIAAMAGAIAGARNGATSIPLDWFARLEELHWLRRLADDLTFRRTLAPQ
ncbi:ADP-ribosylglycohydrolase family protein [Pseudonocardia sp. H11422]|uniref:ADP-ribosylglycohydrolase family protein n=1 Tax=Pseudonocardia sp. H11422 TaxID=2835866 RepID=UPI001BDCCBAB|nr:ADP-ribosylglycohydrolase family protein [Pseudonocardia sp. H11422]